MPSPSALTAPVVAIKVVPLPSARVTITFPTGGLAFDTTYTSTVFRSVNGVRTAIRGSSGLPAIGSVVVMDYEIPFGVNVDYIYTVYDSAGAVYASSPVATVTFDPGQVWLSDPLNPYASVGIALGGASDFVLEADSFARLTRGQRSNRSQVIGRRRPVVQYYGQSALENVEFSIIAADTATDQLLEVLESQPVLIRVPGMLANVPRSFYATVSADEEPLNWNTDSNARLTRFTLSADEVEGQALDVIVQIYNYTYWQQTLGDTATFTSVAGTYGPSGTYTTYQSVEENPPT